MIVLCKKCFKLYNRLEIKQKNYRCECGRVLSKKVINKSYFLTIIYLISQASVHELNHLFVVCSEGMVARMTDAVLPLPMKEMVRPGLKKEAET